MGGSGKDRWCDCCHINESEGAELAVIVIPSHFANGGVAIDACRECRLEHFEEPDRAADERAHPKEL